MSIRKLDEAVINRIAAGEIIHRPANALKEMLENSLDAGSTNIAVVAKGGGMKMLQITDNGHGIKVEDFPIVCERFTTSKLTKFEDLNSIATYGFRGEALASISHVAHLTIVSKTADSPCAYRAHFSDGVLAPAQSGESADPKPCAGTTGTQITVEDLFYNVVTRRKALGAPTDEYNHILDVVQKYAMHNAGVVFSCKKFGESGADLHTQSKASVLDNIRAVHGPSIARELLPFDVPLIPELGFAASGHISNANYSVKKRTFILFINHRLVDCTSIRKAVESVYTNYLPKGSFPFCYLSVMITPQNIDVNVHPTKKEVHFLHEEQIVEALQRAVEQRLLDANQSRTFLTQTLLPGVAPPADSRPSGISATSSAAPHTVVRTDERSQSMDAFVVRGKRKESSDLNPTPTKKVPTSRREITLISVLSLQEAIRQQAHEGLRDVIKHHKFVGVVDHSLALIQHQTKLYLVDLSSFSKELFYCYSLLNFSNFGRLRLSEPPLIMDLLMAALNDPAAGWEPEDGPKEQLAAYILQLLNERAEMLLDYFSMEIRDNSLLCLPQIVTGYVPPLEHLPMFVLRLGTEVDWTAEKECFETLSRELAQFYSIRQDTVAPAYGDHDPAWVVEHVLFPAARQGLEPSEQLARDGSFVQVASLENLYKIFERC